MPELPPPGPADRALLERILTEDGIQTDPGARLDEVLAALLHELLEWLGKGPDLGLSGAAELAVLVGLGLLGVVALWAVFRLVGRLRARRLGEAPPAVQVEDLELPPDPTSALEAALAAGDARAALAALWAELALGLGQAGVARAAGRDRTHQELVRAVRRSRPGWEGLVELTDLARVLDRLCYGPEAPTVDAVRALVPRARGLVA